MVTVLVIRPLDARWLLHGVSTKAADGSCFPDHFYASLAGNSYVGPVFAALLIAILTLMTDDMLPSSQSQEEPLRKEQQKENEDLDFIGSFFA